VALLREGPETVAAFIAEPVIGAAGGALVAPRGYFERVREICNAYGVLLIADEVITCFGRLGRWFGVERFNIQPDLLVFAKGVSGGYAPLGGFIVRRSLVDVFRAGSGRFEHNFTMAGHPVACAAGVAAVTALEREGLVDRVASLEAPLFAALNHQLRDLPIVGDVRGLGLLAGVEFVSDRSTKEPFPPSDAMAGTVTRYARDEGVIVYPCQGGVNGEAGDYILIMPPFVSTDDQIQEMIVRLRRALERLCRDLHRYD
jgi:adenosylmethionine-8-amino-7-oxononanoate aminotransferase